MKQLILDAGPLIALFYQKDSYHQSAIKGFIELNQNKTQLITPIPIIFEVYKWLLHRGGNLLAKKTLSVMENSLYSVTLEDEDIKKLYLMIQSLTDWEGSLEDATVILISQKYNSPIWTLNYRDFSRFKNLNFWNPQE
ncbi:type II toxin-antitoxin system VapC family toxin [Geminocystis herdmanii]|uniref:type II toxin-antitoxin system VapC family toxin n=1 Tax=Geminocystis herdmanii TaxID=669359 RepID=UPI000346C8E9|nr:type II toxin-antitoxin system VapC family toxin [Geminocystis herdmanii]